MIEQQAALLKQRDAEIAALVQEIEDQRRFARRNLIVAAVLALTSLAIAAAMALRSLEGVLTASAIDRPSKACFYCLYSTGFGMPTSTVVRGF